MELGTYDCSTGEARDRHGVLLGTFKDSGEAKEAMWAAALPATFLFLEQNDEKRLPKWKFHCIFKIEACEPDEPDPFEPPDDPDPFDIEAHAEILAAKATEGYRQAIYWDGEYVGRTYGSHDLIFGLIDLDDYPSVEIFDAVHDAACAIIDDWGSPWMTEEDYAALTGRDEPPDLPDKDLTADLLAQAQLKLLF